MRRRTGRTTILIGLFLCGWALAALPAETPAEIRIGYLKTVSLLPTKALHTLENRFAARGVKINWFEFSAAAPLLEAINSGRLDFGAGGDTAGVFAQAASTNFVYVGYNGSSGKNMALLARRDAPIHSMADLKSRRIGFARGSTAQFFVVMALRKAGLGYGDITPVYLSPADAALAFQVGAIDAWAIWDPYFAIAEKKLSARVLVTAEGIAPGNSIYVAAKAFAAKYPYVVLELLEEVANAESWAVAHPEEMARLMAEETRGDLDIQRRMVDRARRRLSLFTSDDIRHQQEIADVFHSLGLIPTRVDVSELAWRPPEGYAGPLGSR